MVTKEDLFFRQVVTLHDGARVLLRPLIVDDRQSLLDLFLPTSVEERSYMRHNVSDPTVVNEWVDHLDYGDVFPIVAIVGHRVVGTATLHFNSGPARHRAELRIFLAKDFRHRGLGNKMLLALIDQGKKRSLYMLEAQVVSELVNDIKALQKAGFKTQCVLEDYFQMPTGELYDVVHLVLHLRPPEDDF